MVANNTATGALALVLLLGCSAPDPRWPQTFGYSPEEVHGIEIGQFGYPYVPVAVDDATLMLPFDTGNMVGVSLSSANFDKSGLTTVETYVRRNSAGEVVATLRVGEARDVAVLGRAFGPRPIYELDHPTLEGLVGPSVLGGGHFTMDYGTRRIGVADRPLPETIPGYRSVPLVRSSRHPTLILVHGSIEGRRVLFELDTGKSRTVVNPGLAVELGLERGSRGVRIEALQMGELSFRLPSAKEVDQTAIDPGLPEPILAGVGSDILSRFVWTVDYGAGVLWIPEEL